MARKPHHEIDSMHLITDIYVKCNALGLICHAPKALYSNASDLPMLLGNILTRDLFIHGVLHTYLKNSMKISKM